MLLLHLARGELTMLGTAFVCRARCADDRLLETSAWPLLMSTEKPSVCVVGNIHVLLVYLPFSAEPTTLVGIATRKTKVPVGTLLVMASG